MDSNEQDRRNKLKLTKPLVYDKILKFKDKIERGESIAIIQLQYDYRCNFSCQHCSIKRFQNKGTFAFNDKQTITLEDVKNLYQQADKLGLARTTITGGEPLLFPDLDGLVEAINPQKFYINCDSNGWLLTEEKAKHLKSIGIDRIQLSIDSLNEEEHDSFRNAIGSWKRAIRAVDACKKADLDIFIQTVVTKQRLHSNEFIDFLEYFNGQNIGVFVSYAKPVGSWEGHFEGLVNKEDIQYMQELEKIHEVFTHLTPAYGLKMGCIAVKGMISVTKYGDVLPCPYIPISIGNILKESLKEIINRGFSIRYFRDYIDTCLIAEDREWIDKYIVKGTYGRKLPVSCKEVFK